MIKRGDIFYAKLSKTQGSEQGGTRPVIILQNDLGNKFSKTVIVVPVTSSTKQNLPTHVYLKQGNFGIKKDSIILTEQIITIDKKRLNKKIGKVSDEIMNKVKKAIEISIGLRGKISFKNAIKTYLNKNKKYKY